VALLPGRFDAAGNAVYALPLSAPIPTAAGTSVFFQGAQTTPTLGLSNGLRVTVTPR
jgi:hypothetical protein